MSINAPFLAKWKGERAKPAITIEGMVMILLLRVGA
jgi:hypothetical protein